MGALTFADVVAVLLAEGPASLEEITHHARCSSRDAVAHLKPLVASGVIRRLRPTECMANAWHWRARAYALTGRLYRA